jgi:hypothetical protein
MATGVDPQNVQSFLPAVVVLLNNIADSLVEPESAVSESSDEAPLLSRVTRVHNTLVDMNSVVASVLHEFRFAHARTILDEELGFWVRPRPTAWFSQFLLHEYDDDRWVANFRFTKASVFHISAVVSPHYERQDTTYRKAVPIRVRVACCLYKLVQGSSFLQCSELFAIGKSTVSGVIRDVVQAINVEFRSEIVFPRGNRLATVMGEFKEFCGIPGVAGAVDGTHIHIRKPSIGPEDYFYFKSSGYTMQMQAVVDRQKRFIDVAVGMPGSTHDSRMLRRSSLFQMADSSTLFDEGSNMDGFTPFLLGDAGYPLKHWLMTPYRDTPGRRNDRSVLQRLYNKRLSRGRSVIENAFGILKHSFRELLHVTDLHVAFVPDMVVCCCLLHNLLLGQDPDEVARLLEILHRDGIIPDVDDVPVLDPAHEVPRTMEFNQAEAKRGELGVFLGRQRHLDV